MVLVRRIFLYGGELFMQIKKTAALFFALFIFGTGALAALGFFYYRPHNIVLASALHLCRNVFNKIYALVILKFFVIPHILAVVFAFVLKTFKIFHAVLRI